VLIPAIQAHQNALGPTPHPIAADAAFYSGKNDAEAKAMGVKRVRERNRTTKSPARKQRAEETVVPQRANMAHGV
jgi:transposase, IS5 family